MMTRVVVRGFANGVRMFEEKIDVADEDIDELIPRLAEKHAERMAPHKRHMIEIEFPDDPNPEERFFRFGTDPSGMRRPIGLWIQDRGFAE